jgi:hypothetical protein
VDDPYDLSESAWRRRFSQRLAETRSLERARARAEAIAAAAECAADELAAATRATQVATKKRAPSPAQLQHLATMRAHRDPDARWRGVPPEARIAFARARGRDRWRTISPAERHRYAVMMATARWHPPPDPKAAPGGGRYR